MRSSKADVDVDVTIDVGSSTGGDGDDSGDGVLGNSNGAGIVSGISRLLWWW